MVGWTFWKWRHRHPLSFSFFYSMSRFKRYFTGSFRVFLRICRCFNRKISLHPILALGGSTEEKVPGLKASTAAGLRQRHVRAFFLGHHKCTYLIIFIDIHSSCVIWCVYIIYLYYCITYVYIYIIIIIIIIIVIIIILLIIIITTIIIIHIYI